MNELVRLRPTLSRTLLSYESGMVSLAELRSMIVDGIPAMPRGWDESEAPGDTWLPSAGARCTQGAALQSAEDDAAPRRRRSAPPRARYHAFCCLTRRQSSHESQAISVSRAGHGALLSAALHIATRRRVTHTAGDDRGRHSIGVIGCGYWGSKHVRVLHGIDGVAEVALIDERIGRLDEFRAVVSERSGVHVARRGAAARGRGHCGDATDDSRIPRAQGDAGRQARTGREAAGDDQRRRRAARRDVV